MDIETTGLDPDRHEIWELAVVTVEDGPGQLERVWQFPVDLSRADPAALRVGQFYARRLKIQLISKPRAAAAGVARLLDGATFAAANPTFDAGFIERWLRANGQCGTWHYSLLDVKSMAAGKLGLAPPFGTTAELARLLGIDPDGFDRHTALGDARLAHAMYQACLAPGSTSGEYPR